MNTNPKTIAEPVTEVLSTNATILDSSGHVAARGVTVTHITEPSYSEYASRYVIGRTEHVASDILHEGDKLESLAFGWTVSL